MFPSDRVTVPTITAGGTGGMNVDSKEAEEWTLALRVAEIIYEGVPGARWPEATIAAQDIVTRVIMPKLDRH